MEGDVTRPSPSHGVPMLKLLLVSSMAIAGTSVAGSARADCIGIDHANYAITSPGSYCLTKNLIATSNGISINADHVNLQCGGYTIDGSALPTSTTKRGVVGTDRSSITIQNCTIKGFQEGIRLTGTGIIVRGNTIIAPLSRGIYLYGGDNIIDGNRVSDAGGATNSSVGAFGIYARGSTIIRGNVISGVVPAQGSNQSGFGIYTLVNDAGVVQGNTVRNVIGDGGQIAMAVTAYTSSNALLRENILVNPPGTYGYALYCTGSGSVASGNIFRGFTNGLSSSCGAP